MKWKSYTKKNLMQFFYKNWKYLTTMIISNVIFIYQQNVDETNLEYVNFLPTGNITLKYKGG